MEMEMEMEMETDVSMELETEMETEPDLDMEPDYSATRGPESKNSLPTKPRKYLARHQVFQERNQGFSATKAALACRAGSQR